MNNGTDDIEDDPGKMIAHILGDMDWTGLLNVPPTEVVEQFNDALRKMIRGEIALQTCKCGHLRSSHVERHPSHDIVVHQCMVPNCPCCDFNQ